MKEKERKCSAIGSLRGFLFFLFLSKHSNEHNKLAFLPLSPFLEKLYHCQRFNVHLGLSFVFQKGVCFIQKRKTSNIPAAGLAYTAPTGLRWYCNIQKLPATMAANERTVTKPASSTSFE